MSRHLDASAALGQAAHAEEFAMRGKLLFLIGLLALARPAFADPRYPDDDDERIDEYQHQAAQDLAQEEETAREHPEKHLGFAMRWHRDGFDTILKASALAIRNDNSFPVKDFRIRCVGAANSGTQIQTIRFTLYERLNAHAEKNWFDLNMGFLHQQVAELACGIDGATMID
jgi:hypothetical protein